MAIRIEAAARLRVTAAATKEDLREYEAIDKKIAMYQSSIRGLKASGAPASEVEHYKKLVAEAKKKMKTLERELMKAGWLY